MANDVIVKGVLDLLSDHAMKDRWNLTVKNTYKFADISVSPAGIVFDGDKLKLSFTQRLTFLQAFTSLQEYHYVKKFHKSITTALEK